MPLPEARPGLVFRYEYIWKRQELAGRTVGEKERPACVVLAISGPAESLRVMIVPITTQPPPEHCPVLEIPPRVIRHLGLDDGRRSWIILSEANIDAWPSPDMRPIPGRRGIYQYGLLPQRMVNTIRKTVIAAAAAGTLPTTDRED